MLFSSQSVCGLSTISYSMKFLYTVKAGDSGHAGDLGQNFDSGFWQFTGIKLKIELNIFASKDSVWYMYGNVVINKNILNRLSND